MIIRHVDWYAMFVIIRVQEKAIWLNIVKLKNIKSK